MNRAYSVLAALALTIGAAAQTMNVEVGSVTYQFPAAQAGEMTYDSGTTLTILGRAFAIDDITQMYVDDTEVTDNLVQVNYDGASATLPATWLSMWRLPSAVPTWSSPRRTPTLLTTTR